MKKKKKIGALFMTAFIVISLLAGCTNNNTSSETAPSANGDNVTETSFPDYSKGFPEKVNLDIPVYERAFEGWNVTDNYYTRYIQKEFGDKYNVNVKFVPITRSSEVTDFEQLLASRKAPDIIFHYEMPQALSYYGEGVLQSLNVEEIANYAPTYWESMGDTIKQYGEMDGDVTFVFAERPDFSNFVSIIRKDWVEKVGMRVEDITSLEKYNELLTKWKDAGLGVAGAGLTRNVYNYSYAFRDWPVDPKTHALYSDLSIADFTTPASEAWLRNLSYQYHNGLIDREFYLRDDENKGKAEFVAGKTGTFGMYVTNNTDVYEATKKNNPEAEFAVLPPGAAAPEGNVPQGRANWPFGMIMGINYESTAEERAAVWMYLEWMSQPEHLFLLQNGIEGENYTLDSEGLPIKNGEFTGESVLSQNNNKDYWCLVTEAAVFTTPELTLKANKRNWTTPGYEQIVEDMIKYADETKSYLLPDPLFSVVLENVNEYKADLNALFQEIYLDVVLAPEAEFDARYEEAKEKYLQGGYQEVIDEKQKAIDAGQFK